jgi:hypothetical protein
MTVTWLLATVMGNIKINNVINAGKLLAIFDNIGAKLGA